MPCAVFEPRDLRSTLVSFAAPLTALLLLLVATLPAFAAIDDLAALDPDYQDRIYLRNGDRITGNIKYLERGKLFVKTRTMDDVLLSWEQVASIDSNKYLRVEHIDGSFLYGQPRPTGQDGELTISGPISSADVAVLDVVAARSLRDDESLWRRISGDVSAGVDYKNAADILVINAASSAYLREERYEIGANFEWNQTMRTEANNASRMNLGADYKRLLADNWFWRASSAYERNDQIGLNGRILTALTGGRFLQRTNRRRWEVSVGVAANAEERVSGQRIESLEAAFQTSYDLFLYNIPRQRLSASMSLYPSLTESDRIRADTRLTLRSELFTDLFWDLQFYSNYDSASEADLDSTDYGVVTSLGYSF